VCGPVGDGLEAQPTHFEDGAVFDEKVVGGEHPGIGGRHRHGIAGVADGRDGLYVVPVAVGLEHLAHPEVPAHLEQQLVFVGGVDEDRLACLFAPDDVHVVVHGPTTTRWTSTRLSS